MTEGDDPRFAELASGLRSWGEAVLELTRVQNEALTSLTSLTRRVNDLEAEVNMLRNRLGD